MAKKRRENRKGKPKTTGKLKQQPPLLKKFTNFYQSGDRD